MVEDERERFRKEVEMAKNLFLSGKKAEAYEILRKNGYTFASIGTIFSNWAGKPVSVIKSTGEENLLAKKNIAKRPTQPPLPEAKPNEQLQLPTLERIRAGSEEAAEELEKTRAETAKKREEELKKEQETREGLTRAGLLPPGTPIEEARGGSPPQQNRQPIPPGPPGDAGGGNGFNLSVRVTPQNGGTTVPEAGRGYVYPANSAVVIQQRANQGSIFDHWIVDGAQVGGLDANGEQSAPFLRIMMDSNHSVFAVFTETVQPIPPGPPAPQAPQAQQQPNQPRRMPLLLALLLAGIITLFVYFVFYRPILLEGLGFYDPYTPPWLILNAFVPIGFFGLLFFLFVGDRDLLRQWWVPILLAVIVAIFVAGLVLAMEFTRSSPTLYLGIPFIVGLVTWFVANRDIQAQRGMGPVMVHIVSVLFVIGILMFGINLVVSGDIVKIDTYLRPFDVLRVVGVPQESIDSMKDGVRSVLSYLSFKGAEPDKPEVKKVGGFEAIELSFGSRQGNFALPAILARNDYTLPITVTNPNKAVFGTNLIAKNVVIDSMFLNNRTDDRIICGSVDDAGDIKGQIMLGDLNPEEEKETAIEFKGKTTEGGAVSCPYVLQYKGSKNPLYPAKFAIDAVKADGNTIDDFCADESRTGLGNLGNIDQTKYKDCTKRECIGLCRPEIQKTISKYNVLDEIDTKDTAFKKSDDVCACEVIRYFNVMDNLCFFSSDKADVELRSSYEFKVQGKGELIITKTDADKKSAPKPSITSSSGPLTVTAYFVSDVHALDGKLKTNTLFIEVKNDGDGNAELTNVKINNNQYSGSEFPAIDGVKIKNCSPNMAIKPDTQKIIPLIVDDEPLTVVCKVDATNVQPISGSYKTVPVIVDIDYKYSQKHTTALNIKKASIPEGVTDEDQIEELKRSFNPLPYYCPPELGIYPQPT